MDHTVLIVDDDPELLRSLRRTLRRQPYRIETACGAVEAQIIMRTCKIDLIVTDNCMPNFSGVELLGWVAKEMPHVVRIMQTGRASISAAQQAINEGRVFRFLLKPCHDFQLAMAIRDGLEQVVSASG